MLELDFVLDSMNGKIVSGLGKGNFSGVSTDSRKVRGGEIFFALRGDNFDGHEFVDEALGKGAGAAVIETGGHQRANGKLLIGVPSTLRALGDLASSWRKGFPDLKLAAITGSNGKTTTKEMVWSIVSQKHPTLKNTGNFNNLIGLPLTLLGLNESFRAAVVELGMNDFGEIRRLAEIADPDVGAITNIGRAHLEKLGGIDGVARAKGELVESFEGGRTFVVNADDPRIAQIAENTKCDKITYGLKSPGTMLSARKIEQNEFSGIGFLMCIEGTEFPVELTGIGIHNVMNALCASGIALSLGCGKEEIKSGLETFTPEHMRLEVVESPRGFRIINDTYNANPESMRSAIDELVKLKGGGRAIAVLGDMLELGAASGKEHAGLGEYLSALGVDYVVACGKFGSSILNGAGNAVEGSLAATHGEAADIVKAIAKPGDLVLIKGSRGSRMEEVTKILVEGIS
ncbi:MAG: UDP-N-acetylmuramoyl-tripeptide--D-alanyl-D-alanine ligase [Deltaproteobacteria bacterium]